MTEDVQLGLAASIKVQSEILKRIENQVAEVKAWIKDNKDDCKVEMSDVEVRLRHLESAQSECRGKELTHGKFIAIITAIFIFAQVVGAFLPTIIAKAPTEERLIKNKIMEHIENGKNGDRVPPEEIVTKVKKR